VAGGERPGILPIDPDIDSPAPAAAGRTPTPPGVFVAIAVGGGLGATARYGLSRALPTRGAGFPWATFWTNVSGSFVLGLFLVIVVARLASNRYVRPFFATGFLGAYTTFSTFTVETDLLLRDGRLATAAA
jgi:fluoride exporter